MAEVLLSEGEQIDVALSRLKRAVNGEGFLRLVKNQRFTGFQTTSQRKRLKSKKAQSRLRKIERVRNQNFDPLDQYDTEKLRQQEYPAFLSDANWATSDSTWSPDLRPVKLPPAAEALKDAFGRSRQAVLGFGRNYNYDPNVPSTHVCVIIEFGHERKRSLVVVKGFEDDDNKTPRMFHQFP